MQQKKRLFINIFFNLLLLLLFFNGCSYVKNLNLFKQDTNQNDVKKLTRTIEIIEKYYIEEKELYELVNVALDSIFLVKKERVSSTYTKDELFTKLSEAVENIHNNTQYSSEEIIDIALDGVMNSLDKYSTYIGKNSQINSSSESVKIKSFYATTLNKKYLYLKVETFDEKVVNNLKNEIQNAKGNIKGIILDLRDNTGGLLNQAISTVDLFVSEGVILSQRGRDITNVITYRATSKNTITKLPLVVLVNKLSASSSEIVSGALQDLNRAIVIGEKTFGKGTIQALIPITEDKREAIKLTVAKYYLPKGRLVDNKITPDIEILQDETKDKKDDTQLNFAIDFLRHPVKVDFKYGRKERDCFVPRNDGVCVLQ